MQVKSLKITRKELFALKERIRKRELTPEDYDILHALAETVDCLTEALKEKDTSLGRLCKYLFGAPTETARNVIKKPEENKERKNKTPAKGHGRRAASEYHGGKKVVIEHPSLHPGDQCPGCLKGKVYELAMPSVFVQLIGQAPFNATVFERKRLRCNLCGEVFVPKLPVEGKKHDETAASMLALLKYGCGLPLNRIDNLQESFGQPLSASTQWDILNASAFSLSPVVDAMMKFAAQGSLIHNDDTTMKVLSFLNQDSERKGVYTTAIVSKCEERRVALFMTGHNHAGENLTEVLKNRIKALAPPIQMCDASSMNTSKDFETILANCLAHARRQFVDIVDHFPDECRYVIEQFAQVYHNDTLTGQMTPEQRLSYHKEQSGPVMEDLKGWCERQLEEKKVEPNSELGKAVNYLLRHWKALTRFLEVPGAPLDNNICERGLKCAIRHRKNSLFYKTQRGAHVGDLFMSLIHTCQLQGVNPLAYLTWLLKNASDLKRAPENYLPWRYGKAPP